VVAGVVMLLGTWPWDWLAREQKWSEVVVVLSEVGDVLAV